jgi:hypothetical protein
MLTRQGGGHDRGDQLPASMLIVIVFSRHLDPIEVFVPYIRVYCQPINHGHLCEPFNEMARSTVDVAQRIRKSRVVRGVQT